MYDNIKDILDHTWQTTTNNSTEQQIIYYICGALVIILVVTFIDLLYRVFRNFWKRGV